MEETIDRVKVNEMFLTADLPKYKVGDVVVMSSGGPKLTVVAITWSEVHFVVDCFGFGEDNRLLELRSVPAVCFRQLPCQAS